MYFVYFLKSESHPKQTYVGFTHDILERIKRHNEGSVQSTKPYIPWELLFYEAYKNERDAKNREQYLKTTKGRRALKLMLANSLEN